MLVRSLYGLSGAEVFRKDLYETMRNPEGLSASADLVVTSLSHYEQLFPLVGEEKTFTFEASRETFGAYIYLLPTHPVVGDRLSFSISVDGGEAQTFEYQTYDRSEEWKRNVLRNHAYRFLPLELEAGTRHTLTFKALTEGVYLRSIRLVQ